MMHKKIFEAVLSDLDSERAEYFSSIADKLEADPRAQQAPNLIFLVLKDTAPFLPNYLPSDEFIDALLVFVSQNIRELSGLIYSREFIEDPGALRKISSKFVGRVLEVILKNYDEGGFQEGQHIEHRVSWPYDSVDFPYVDDGD